MNQGGRRPRAPTSFILLVIVVPLRIMFLNFLKFIIKAYTYSIYIYIYIYPTCSLHYGISGNN
jgi:hypothetical protein